MTSPTSVPRPRTGTALAELRDTVPRLLADNLYCVLATSDADGEPWATPVYFSAPDAHTLLWVSSPASRHSRNIAARAQLAITVFDSTVAVGAAEAVYLEATARIVEPDEYPTALEVLNRRVPAEKALTVDDLRPAGGLHVYRARATAHFVLVRGGDERFDNVTDARVAVDLG